MKKVFLIVNYNDFKTTKILLDNIKNYKVLDEIIVVDNNSKDNSFLLLSKLKYKKLTVLKTDVNKGYGGGINFGTKYVNDKYKEALIVVSNSDIVIDSEDVLVDLFATFKSDIGIVAPIIREHTGLNRGWKVPSPFKDSLLNIVGIHRFLRPKLIFYKDSYYTNEVIDVEAVSGCFFVINSKYLKQVDYFDENIFLYYEENMISKKLEKINKRIVINTKVKVFHNHSVSIDKSINKINKYKELKKSQLYFQKKYNNANFLEIFLLQLTSKVSLLILSVVYKIKDIKKKKEEE